jgi:hypothetical protein
MARRATSEAAETEAAEACLRLMETPPSPHRLLQLADLATAAFADAGPAARRRRALGWLMADEPPPFATALYASWLRDATESPRWTAVDLILGAQADLAAAYDLQSGGARAVAGPVSRMAQEHAAAARHMFDLAATAFPTAVPPALHAQLKAMQHRPEATARPETATSPDLVEAVMLHLAELRTACRGLAQVAAAREHAPSEARDRCTRQGRRLLSTRLRLVALSAGLVDKALPDSSGAARDMVALAARRHIRATAEAPIDYTYHLRFGTYP